MSFQKTWAIIIGIILVLVGIIGFFNNPVLSIFPVNTLHNFVHLATGIVFLWAGWANKGQSAKPVNKWLGVIYILVGIIGFFGVLGFLSVTGGNDPDNWLHIIVGVVSAIVGWSVK